MDNLEYKIEEYLAEYCREERQYALFLNELLRDEESGDLRKSLGIGNHIIEIIYEASFLRDLVYKHGTEINKALMEFAGLDVDENNGLFQIGYNMGARKGKETINQILDSRENKESDKSKEMHMRFHILSLMMNAKPDIVIIYKDENDKKYALAIECKMESKEGMYKDYEDADGCGKEIIYQTLIQNAVMAFLFGEYDNELKQKEDSSINSDIKERRDEYIKCINDMISYGNNREQYETATSRKKGIFGDIINKGVIVVRFDDKDRSGNQVEKKEDLHIYDKNNTQQYYISKKEILKKYNKLHSS